MQFYKSKQKESLSSQWWTQRYKEYKK